MKLESFVPSFRSSRSARAARVARARWSWPAWWTGLACGVWLLGLTLMTLRVDGPRVGAPLVWVLLAGPTAPFFMFLAPLGAPLLYGVYAVVAVGGWRTLGTALLVIHHVPVALFASITLASTSAGWTDLVRQLLEPDHPESMGWLLLGSYLAMLGAYLWRLYRPRAAPAPTTAARRAPPGVPVAAALGAAVGGVLLGLLWLAGPAVRPYGGYIDVRIDIVLGGPLAYVLMPYTHYALPLLYAGYAAAARGQRLLGAALFALHHSAAVLGSMQAAALGTAHLSPATLPALAVHRPALAVLLACYGLANLWWLQTLLRRRPERLAPSGPECEKS